MYFLGGKKQRLPFSLVLISCYLVILQDVQDFPFLKKIIVYRVKCNV